MELVQGYFTAGGLLQPHTTTNAASVLNAIGITCSHDRYHNDTQDRLMDSDNPHGFAQTQTQTLTQHTQTDYILSDIAAMCVKLAVFHLCKALVFLLVHIRFLLAISTFWLPSKGQSKDSINVSTCYYLYILLLLGLAVTQ